MSFDWNQMGKHFILAFDSYWPMESDNITSDSSGLTNHTTESDVLFLRRFTCASRVHIDQLKNIKENF